MSEDKIKSEHAEFLEHLADKTPEQIRCDILSWIDLSVDERPLLNELLGLLINKSERTSDEQASRFSVDALVMLLKKLRGEWVKERDRWTFSNRKFAEKKAGIYALDEAIKTVKAGEVTRYKDENIKID